MPMHTDPAHMPANPQEALAWLSQRCTKVIDAAMLCFRFGPDQLDASEAERRLEEGLEVQPTNMQMLLNRVVSLERTIYVFYNQMSGRVTETSDPGVVERLARAEATLSDLSKSGNSGAIEYFAWLNASKVPVEKDAKE